MCGIVGYIGPKSVSSVLLVGLQKLEYRGYDSAGIAIMDRADLAVQKNKGKISGLTELVDKKPMPGSLGIGHTRWATHGEPSKINSHPHMNTSKNIAVVQNGIIENYLELKKELIDDGFIFASDTDTEVIPHLFEKYLRDNFRPEVAFLRTLKRIDGKFAIALVTEKEPNRIFFARDGAPLILGIGKDDDNQEKENFLASDLPALVPLAKKAYYIKDGECGYIEQGKVVLSDFEGNPKQPSYEKIQININDIDKGDFEHYMLKEIYEQPEMVERILMKRINEKKHIQFEELNLERDYLSRIGRVVIQASGTSLHAGFIAKNYFEQYVKIFADADYSSEFRYRNPVVDGDSLVIAISQSGETADTLASLHEAKAKFIKVLSFINNINSTMARESDAMIDLMAGPEIGVASTKAYTAELLNMFLFSLYLSSVKWILPKEERIGLLDEVYLLPEKMRSIIQSHEPLKKIAQYLNTVNDTIFLGRTYNFPTALEGALKLKEISYIHASGYAGGEFKHGPIALVSEKVPVIAIVPKSDIRAKMMSNIQEVKARNGKIISIITEGDEEVKELSDFYFEIPDTAEPLSPILSIVPLQLISYYTALYRGCDVDQPRNLAKSVTVE